MGRLIAAASPLLFVCAGASAQEAAPESAPPPVAETGPAAPPAEAFPDHAPVIVRQKVLRRPTFDEVSALYPKAAVRKNLDGEVHVSCHVGLSTKLEGCTVTSESPAGYGFGEAGLAVAGLFRVAPPSIDGRPLADTRFDIPIRYTMSKAPPAPSSAPSPQRARNTLAPEPAAPATAPAAAPAPKRPAVRAPGVLLIPGIFCGAVLATLLIACFAPVRVKTRRKAGQYA